MAKTKRVVSSLLALIAVFSCLSIAAFADDNVVYLDDGYYIVYEVEEDVVLQPNSVNETRVVSGKDR